MKTGVILDENGNIASVISMEQIKTPEGHTIQPFLTPPKMGYTTYEFDAPESVIKENQIAIEKVREIISDRKKLRQIL